MRKTNFFVKYLNNINKFINSLLERNLNKINFKNLVYLFKNNKIILTFVAVFVLFLSYLLLPTFYNQADISKEIKQELSKKLNLNFNFTKKLNYNFFPRPHFVTNQASIFDEKGRSNVQFYDYTKSFPRMVDFLTAKDYPSNYHLTFSRSELNDAECDTVLRHGGNVAVVFDTVPDSFRGRPVYNGDDSDLRFLDPRGVWVGLKAKGKLLRSASPFKADVTC